MINKLLILVFFLLACQAQAQIVPVGFMSNSDMPVEVVSLTGKIWMDRNLGASRAATNWKDELSYGNLYQWGRPKDGHEKKTSSITTSLSSSSQPINGLFIIVSAEPRDWQNPQNVNLWQGVNGVNNPCPNGYRIPTKDEWTEEIATWGTTSGNAFASPLKLPLAGLRGFSDGNLAYSGTSNPSDYSMGVYWSSTVNTRVNETQNSYHLDFKFDGFKSVGSNRRAYGFSVRCIKNY